MHTYWKYCLRVDSRVVPGGAVQLGAALKQRGIFSAPRYIQKPAFACEIFREQRTFGSEPLAVHAGPAGGGRLRPRAFPGTYEGLDAMLVLPWNERYTSEHVRYIADSIAASAGRAAEGCRMSHQNAIGTDRRGRNRPDLCPGARAIGDGRVGGRRRRAGRGRRRPWPSGWTARRSRRTKRCSSRRDCEAAIVCTPPVTHPEICCWLLDRGIHVLCEKPLAIGPEEARAMLAAAERSDAQLTMASKFRYARDVVEAKSIVASGVIGDVVLFENAFTSRVDMKQPLEQRSDDQRRRRADR